MAEPRASAPANQPVTILVVADPQPDEIVALLHGQRPVMNPHAR
jgi:hypothetical protein